MKHQRDQLPRIFQVNIGRLFLRVIQPVIERLPMHDRLTTGVTSTLDEFLDRAATQADNYTANEANKTFALVLAAVSEKAGIDLVDHDLGKDLGEAFLVANVVRHGDGTSLQALRAQARSRRRSDLDVAPDC